MLNRLMNMAFGSVMGQLLKQRIRNGSVQAVKGYIQLVKYARLSLMGLFGIAIFGGLFVAGIVLTVIGIVGLLPISTNAVAITTLVIGLLLAIATGVGMFIAFSQRRWLEMSKSYELMDAVLAPWPGMLPPNPVDVVKGRADVPPAPTAEEIREARERRVESDFARAAALATPGM